MGRFPRLSIRAISETARPALFSPPDSSWIRPSGKPQVRLYTDMVDAPTMETSTSPIAQFTEWFSKASKCGIDKPHAMSLSTTAADGRPSARIVLLSSFDERGFVFHTNYESKKGREIEANSRVALVLWWDPLGYQVRIEGEAEKTSSAESDAYFASRPRGSQLGAWASDQSRAIENRAVLDQRLRDLDGQYQGQAVPRPPHWGGYRVTPRVIEFWEHRDDRLHDRLRFERDGNGKWRGARLAP